MDLLLEGLRNRTSVLATRENLFSIGYSDSEPQRAHDVVQALLAIFVESNIGENRKDLDFAQDFIEDQIEDYERKLQEAENELASRSAPSGSGAGRLAWSRRWFPSSAGPGSS